MQAHRPEGVSEASRQKRRVATISAVATIGLVGAKALVGWQTGSLGILSEAAHSGMDFVATVITLLAVRVADRPADQEHHYGHGKVENLSALAQMFLLLLTCLWIIYEACERLLFKHVDIEPSLAAFGILGISIVVDVSRSTALARTAAATGSQALEADALNFRTDIWGSLTVLVGLAGVWAGRRWNLPSLHLADAVAAVAVAGLVLIMCARLGKRAVDALMDRAPLELTDRIRAAILSVPEVREPVVLRTRLAGARLFVDAALSIGRNVSFEGAHAIVGQVEDRIREVAPEASAIIHAEPRRASDESLADAIRLVVDRYAAGAHDVFIYEKDGNRSVDLHLELSGEMPLIEAHLITQHIEEDLRRDFPRLGTVLVHVDPLRAVRTEGPGPGRELGEIRELLRTLAAGIPGIQDVHRISMRRTRDGIWVVCHCTMGARLTVRQAHDLGLELGRRARREMAEIDRVTVHAEPEG